MHRLCHNYGNTQQCNIIRENGKIADKLHCQNKYQGESNQDKLFECYWQFNIEFTQEYCEAKVPLDEAELFLLNSGTPSDAQAELLQCLVQRNAKKSVKYCELYRVNADSDVPCYPTIEPRTIEVCDKI